MRIEQFSTEAKKELQRRKEIRETIFFFEGFKYKGTRNRNSIIKK